MNIHDRSDRSIKNYHGSMNNVSTGDNYNSNGDQKKSMNNDCSSEVFSQEKADLKKNKNSKVFSSFILPAIIISLGTIVAAFLTLLWNK